MTRVVMRPPGQSGKAKRGHLCFDASFETGKSDCFEDQILRFILSMCVCLCVCVCVCMCVQSLCDHCYQHTSSHIFLAVLLRFTKPVLNNTWSCFGV